MPAIADGSKELNVPRRAADILRRARTGAGHAPRIGTPVSWKQFVEIDSVLPVITDVIAITERICSVRQVPRDRYLPPRQARPLVRHFIVGNADSPYPTRLGVNDNEFV